MRKVLLSICFLVFAAIFWGIVSFFPKKHEFVDLIFFVVLLFLPYCFIVWMLWKPRVTKSIIYKAFPITTVLCIIYLFFPCIVTFLFIYSPDSLLHRVGQSPIFYCDDLFFLVNISAREKMVYGAIVLLFLLSFYATMYYWNDVCDKALRVITVFLSVAFFMLTVPLVFQDTAYEERLRYVGFIIFLVLPFCFVVWMSWASRLVNKLYYKAMPIIVGLSFLSLVFPVTASLVLVGSFSRSERYGLESIFAIGVVEFFNDATTGEVLIFEITAILFLLSVFATIFYWDKIARGNSPHADS